MFADLMTTSSFWLCPFWFVAVLTVIRFHTWHPGSQAIVHDTDVAAVAGFLTWNLSVVSLWYSVQTRHDSAITRTHRSSYLPPGRGSVSRPYHSHDSIYPPIKDEKLIDLSRRKRLAQSRAIQ